MRDVNEKARRNKKFYNKGYKMAREIDANVKSVLELLQGNIKFVIPTYQRPYMWESKMQCEQLWSDLIDFIEL